MPPDIEAIAEQVFIALADPTRRAILAALASGGPATATDLAAMGLSWWIGLALAPTVGTRLLAASAAAALLLPAALATAAGISALVLGRHLPTGISRTPRPPSAARRDSHGHTVPPHQTELTGAG